jgi:hypothetical protein
MRDECLVFYKHRIDASVLIQVAAFDLVQEQIVWPRAVFNAVRQPGSSPRTPTGWSSSGWGHFLHGRGSSQAKATDL